MKPNIYAKTKGSKILNLKNKGTKGKVKPTHPCTGKILAEIDHKADSP